MKSLHLLCLLGLSTALSLGAHAADAAEPSEVYQWIKLLEGEWALSPAERQEGKAVEHPAVAPLVGTDATAMRFQLLPRW